MRNGGRKPGGAGLHVPRERDQRRGPCRDAALQDQALKSARAPRNGGCCFSWRQQTDANPCNVAMLKCHGQLELS